MLYNARDQNSAIFNWITKIVMNNWEKMVGDFVDANKNSLYDRVLVLVSIGSSKACSLSTHTSQKLLNYTEN